MNPFGRKKTADATATAVLDADDDRQLLAKEAAKRGMQVVDLEMQLNRLRGRSLRDQLAEFEVRERAQADAQAEKSKARIAGMTEVREAHEKTIAAGIQEAAKLAVWLGRACRAPDRDPGNAGLARFQAAVANGLVFRLREWAREANKGTPPEVASIEV